MYFPIDDILNDTIFGIPKDDTNNWDSLLDALLNNKSEE